MVRRIPKSGTRNGAPGMRPRYPVASAEEPSTYDAANPPKQPGTDIVDTLDFASLTINGPAKLPRQKTPMKTFPFLYLPSELRIRVYEFFFEDALEPGAVLDLEPGNYKKFHRRLTLMRVCRLIHSEASHVFYNNSIFRIFPTYPGRYFKTKHPLLSRLKPTQRALIGTLELRLGPGWSAPPRGWVVNDALGLADCVSAHKLNIFVENDPSDSFYKGFRRSDGFYENFCRDLLTNVLAAMPALQVIEFDGNPGVKKSGDMMRTLLEVASMSGRIIRWGPERGWTDADEKEIIIMSASSARAALEIVGVSVTA